ncbi:MAG: tetratricopeptide repeat protein [Acidobacteriota bacterium]
MFKRFDSSPSQLKALQRAEKLVFNGKLEAAINQYCKIAAENPTDITITNILGDLYVRAGQIPEAIDCFTRIANTDAERGFTAKAIAMFKKVLKLCPNHLEARLQLANLYARNRSLDEATLMYLEAAQIYTRIGNISKATSIYNTVIELNPTNAAVLMKLGAVYTMNGRHDKALEVFLRAGYEFLKRDDQDGALNAYAKALSIKPNSLRALANISTIYLERQQPERIIKLVKNGLNKRAHDPDMLDLLGDACLAAGSFDEAEAVFHQLYNLQPQRFHGLLNLGDAYAQQGEIEKALHQLDTCLPHLFKTRKDALAIEFLRRMLKQSPNHLGALQSLYQVYLHLNDEGLMVATLNTLVKAAIAQENTEAAIESLERLVNLEPYDLKHRAQLNALNGKDSPEELQEPLQKPSPVILVNDIQPGYDVESVMNNISQADLLISCGKSDQAIKVVKQIIDLDPDNVEARQKLKELYLFTGNLDLAASESLQLARILQNRQKLFPAGHPLTYSLPLTNPGLKPQPLSQPSLNPEQNEWGFSLVTPDERRQSERILMNLPVGVAANDGSWKEITETVNISKTGLLFRVEHEVKQDALLRIGLPMPMNLRVFNDSRKLYSVKAMVRHVMKLSSGKKLIGVEFTDCISGK